MGYSKSNAQSTTVKDEVATTTCTLDCKRSNLNNFKPEFYAKKAKLLKYYYDELVLRQPNEHLMK